MREKFDAVICGNNGEENKRAFEKEEIQAISGIKGDINKVAEKYISVQKGDL